MRNINDVIKNIQIDKEVENQIENFRTSILEKIHNRIAIYEVRKRKQHLKIYKYIAVASVCITLVLSFWLIEEKNYFKPDKPAISYVSCPFGHKMFVTLPDGSKVYMNSGTSISYLNTYGKKSRSININGEAFFNVMHNKNIPFIVNCNNIANIKVLGTQFNVEAYSEDDIIRITLARGKVNLTEIKTKRSTDLMPNQQILLDKRTCLLTKKGVNVSDVLAWKRNEMVFNDTPLSEIVKKLERCYNVHIIITSDRLKQVRFNGAFNSSDNCESILSILSTMDTRLKIKKSNKNIRICEVYRK